jgi:hypothetical protein
MQPARATLLFNKRRFSIMIQIIDFLEYATNQHAKIFKTLNRTTISDIMRTRLIKRLVHLKRIIFFHKHRHDDYVFTLGVDSEYGDPLKDFLSHWNIPEYSGMRPAFVVDFN